MCSYQMLVHCGFLVEIEITISYRLTAMVDNFYA